MRFVAASLMIAVGLNGCANSKQSTNARLVRAAAREWLVHHSAFVARNGDYVSGVAIWPNHAEVPVRSAFAREVNAILRLERIDGSWKVIFTEKPSARQSKRPNQSLEPL